MRENNLTQYVQKYSIIEITKTKIQLQELNVTNCVYLSMLRHDCLFFINLLIVQSNHCKILLTKSFDDFHKQKNFHKQKGFYEQKSFYKQKDFHKQKNFYKQKKNF